MAQARDDCNVAGEAATQHASSHNKRKTSVANIDDMNANVHGFQAKRASTAERLDAMDRSLNADAKSSPGLQAINVLSDPSTVELCNKTNVFRFLDLPPEIRNRVYKFAAQDAFERPALLNVHTDLRAFPVIGKIANNKGDKYAATTIPTDSSNDTVPTRTSTELTSSSPMDARHLARREQNLLSAERPTTKVERKVDKYLDRASRTRLAMLLTNRQIYLESSGVFYQSTSLDISQMYRPLMKWHMDNFRAIFHERTRYIRHVEIEDSVAAYFLFESEKVIENAMTQRWHTPMARPPEQAAAIISLRAALHGLESIKVYPDTIEPFHQGAIKLCYCALTHPCSRAVLEDRFPAVKDIVCINMWGSERFQRDVDGCWLQYYTKKKLPRWDDSEGKIWLPTDCFDDETVLSMDSTLVGLQSWILRL